MTLGSPGPASHHDGRIGGVAKDLELSAADPRELVGMLVGTGAAVEGDDRRPRGSAGPSNRASRVETLDLVCNSPDVWIQYTVGDRVSTASLCRFRKRSTALTEEGLRAKDQAHARRTGRDRNRLLSLRRVEHRYRSEQHNDTKNDDHRQQTRLQSRHGRDHPSLRGLAA